MNIPWDDYDEYCRKKWAEAADNWRRGTEHLLALERARIIREEERKEQDEQWHKKNARAHEEERRQRLAEKEQLLKENARVREERERERREREAWGRQVREQQEREEKLDLERRERHRIATTAAIHRARERREEAKAEAAARRQAGLPEQLSDYDDTRYDIRGPGLEQLEEVTTAYEAGRRLDPAESGHYEASYLMRIENQREHALVRMAEYHCERLAGKRMYARPFSQMKLIPCGFEPVSRRRSRLARLYGG
jgi:hypothetical protein